MSTTPRIMISPGEPAGVGPDITIKIAQYPWPAELVVVADPELLISRAKQLNLPLTLVPIDANETIAPHQPGILKILPIALNAPCEAGKINSDNSAYVIHCLELATDECLKNRAHGLVTGPVHKAAINQANIDFTGHTEFLAKRCNAPHVIMLFVTDKMKVALATTHIPLSQVASAITTKGLTTTLRLFASELEKKFHITHPKILVCGLNPHAGESGLLGREEIDIIEPALAQLRAENINVVGPLPADTIFTEKYLEIADAIFSMYHDQALPVVKFQGFSNAVNITLGLPIIRTSVDHGTALDIAGTHHSDAGSMVAALRLAIELATTTYK